MTRSRLVITGAVVAVLAGAAITAALIQPWRHTSGTGTALTVYGPQAGGAIGYTQVKVGRTYRFSFPVPRNKLHQPVTLTGASIETVPAGATIVGYELYSLKDVGSYVLTYDESDPANIGDLQHKKNYIDSHVTIAPRSDSDYWAMVAVKVTGPVARHLTGCVYRYTVGSKHYQQEFPCEFQLGGAAS